MKYILPTAIGRDFTCISGNPLFATTAPVSLFGIGPGQPPILFQRYLSNNKVTDIPDGNQDIISSDIERKELLPGGQGYHLDPRGGVFSCSSNSNGSSQILVINHWQNNRK